MKALNILKILKELSAWIKCGAELPYDEEIDEAIAEIEELMKPKTCDDCAFDWCGCSIQDSILQCDDTSTFETFCCNKYEPKA